MADSRAGDYVKVPRKVVASVSEKHIDASRAREMEAAVSDLGEVGMFIEMADPPPKGTIVEVKFKLPEGGAERTVLGIVRWREKVGPRAGAGVRLAPIGGDARIDVRDIIRCGGEEAES